MTIEIRDPELEALLEQRIRAGNFTDAADWLLHQLRGETRADAPRSQTPSEKADEFEAWADDFPEVPALSDEAISREGFYPDRG